MIRVPVYMNEEILRYKKAYEKLTHKLRRKPRTGELGQDIANYRVSKVKDLEKSISKMSSLEAPIGDDGESQVKDIIEDPDTASPDETMEIFFNKERDEQLLGLCWASENARYLDMRYGLTDGETHTLSEIAKVLGVSRERVRQLEAATIKKIRQDHQRPKASTLLPF
jgi:RNA polymerase primary sigma factor